ncbi:MAG: nucleotidyltransferase domain-containing protein [Longimicrobiales bacterium]
MKPSEQALRDARGFTTDLVSALGTRLRSAILYGSAARDEFVPVWSDINILLFADEVDAPLLARAAPVLQRYEERRVQPLLLPWGDRMHAADAFAIELMDMQDAHVLLGGEEPFEGSMIEMPALRLQAERELRSRLATLDSRLLWVARDDDAVGHLLIVALPSFVTYMRAALRLGGQNVPPAMRDVIVQAASVVDAPSTGLLAALDGRTSPNRWKPQLTDPLVSQYRAAVQRTASYVDSIERGLR